MIFIIEIKIELVKTSSLLFGFVLRIFLFPPRRFDTIYNKKKTVKKNVRDNSYSFRKRSDRVCVVTTPFFFFFFVVG